MALLSSSCKSNGRLLTDINQAGLGPTAVRVVQAGASETQRDFYAELPITIKVTGNYHDLGAFASDMASCRAS